MVAKFSDPSYDNPVLADPAFTEKVRTHLRWMYKKVQDIQDSAVKELDTARKSGAHIGKLIQRKRTAQQLLKQIEVHGKRDVFLTPEDRELMFRYHTEADFIKHLSFYLTRYE